MRPQRLGCWQSYFKLLLVGQRGRGMHARTKEGEEEDGSCSCSLGSPDYSVKSALLVHAQQRVGFSG